MAFRYGWAPKTRPAKSTRSTRWLRYEFDSDIFGLGSAHQPCPDLTVQPSEPCVWLAGVLGLDRSKGLNNWGPRFGFAWDPFNRQSTVIRGGYGQSRSNPPVELRVPPLESAGDSFVN